MARIQGVLAGVSLGCLFAMTSGVNGQAACAGTVDVVIQDQMRFVFAQGFEVGGDCDEQFGADAAGFEPFSAAFDADCKVGTASVSHASTIDTTGLFASSEASVDAPAGEPFVGSGFAQSMYRVDFSTTQPTLARINGSIDASGVANGFFGMGSITLLHEQAGLVVNESVFLTTDEPVDFQTVIVLAANADFRLEAFADAIAQNGSADVAWIIDVCFEEVVPGDLNLDGTVGVSDLLILLGNYGQCAGGEPCAGDFDNDGDVDVLDLLVILNNWG